ncbi:phosphotransferase family protein [uncultured Devosia sp.]|uniref:phosphotransferase family protein n=1 Tax=uncultured Devosia sp. TaxID=211434 RepID=UPI0035CC2002
MMQPIQKRAIDLLIELKLLPQGATAEVQPLTGGVSSDIALVRSAEGNFCVKFALTQLKVAAVWTAPVGRNAADYAWLDYVAGFSPERVPQLFGQSDRLGGFAMAYLEPTSYPNWKIELLAGRVDPTFAGAVGAALAAIHARSAKDPAGRAAFDNKGDFRQLRLEPYLVHIAGQHPDLAPLLDHLVKGQDAARIALVHGDVSPKNILMGPRGPVFLDAECAVEGDPAFDIAFCLNHLAIKVMAPKGVPEALSETARALWSAYVDGVVWEDRPGLEARVALLLPALMLARVDGKSPVEYLDMRQRDRLRDLARRLLLDPPAGVEAIIGAAQNSGTHPS